MADRYYAPDLLDQPGEFLLTGPEAHHLATVCRAKVGEEIVLFNGAGRSARGTIVDLAKRQVLVAIVAVEVAPLPVDRTLGVAFPKGDRSLMLIEKCVELGIARVVPLLCERSVLVPGEGKLDRLARTVIEACKQCGRDHLMKIEPPTELRRFLSEGPGWQLDPVGRPVAISVDRVPSRVAIGPEGGWTEQEREEARALGWDRVRIAGHVLRVETAAMALAACAAIQNDGLS
jgi:16S rRNA (uracil1498-N3)-methyltransferase